MGEHLVSTVRTEIISGSRSLLFTSAHSDGGAFNNSILVGDIVIVVIVVIVVVVVVASDQDR